MKTTWQAPSNIALVKYWGKRHPQLPSNASLSMTLDACHSQTTVEATAGSGFEFTFEGEAKPAFRPKIEQFLSRIADRHPWLVDWHLDIQSQNSFPHSSGIASSASAFAALSQCIVDLAQQQGMNLENPQREASILARLGSGSASRSVYGGWVHWGAHDGVKGSHDEFAMPHPGEIHPDMMQWHDSILLVDVGQKAVSSTAGHQLMETHPFAKQRFAQAHQHIADMGNILAQGDVMRMIDLAENEALTLHGLMMSSNPSYILMRPNTLKIIELVRELRRDTGMPVGFTLDAGANVHLLYHNSVMVEVRDFIDNALKQFCKNGRYIHDQIGMGPVNLT